jgi:hypothetical protein
MCGVRSGDGLDGLDWRFNARPGRHRGPYSGCGGLLENGGRDRGAVVAHGGSDHPRESEAARERIMGRAGALEGADLEDEFLGGHRDPLDDPHFLVPLSKNRLELLSGSRRRYHRHL